VYFPFLEVGIIFDAKFEKSFECKGSSAKRLRVEGGILLRTFGIS